MTIMQVRRSGRGSRAVLVAAATLLTACAGGPDNGSVSTYEDFYVPDEDVSAGLRLIDDERAELSWFPQGSTVQQADGSLCFEVSTRKRYSGEATWTMKSPNHVSLTFGDSEVPVLVEGSRFGSQRWDEIRIVECGEPKRIWWLGVECGDTGARFDSGTDATVCWWAQ